MSRKPLIAGNWKMNLNHFEAIALVQKIAFSLPEAGSCRLSLWVFSASLIFSTCAAGTRTLAGEPPRGWPVLACLYLFLTCGVD